MSEMDKETNWELTLGFYEGILFGVRSYITEYKIIHSLYIPFVNLCLTIDKSED